MMKLPLCSKTLEFTTGKLRAIVRDDNLWNTVSCKLSFDFVDNCGGQSIIEFVDLKKNWNSRRQQLCNLWSPI